VAKIKVTQDGTTVQVGNDDVVDVLIPGGGEVTIEAKNSNTSKLTVSFDDDTQSDIVNIDLSTFSQNLQIDIKQYDPTDVINLLGAFNQSIDPNNPDEYTFQYVGADGNTYTGFVQAKDGGEKDFTQGVITICFGEGTLIRTPNGPVRVEDLTAGDLVNTRDHGPLPVRWIGNRRLGTLDLTRHPELRPVRVLQGALGRNRPSRDLILSPMHRVLISDWRAEFLFGTDEVMVPIKSLVNDHDIRILSDATGVNYYHLLFDQHEVIFSNGLMTESLYAGKMALGAVSNEVFEIFPELAEESFAYGPTACKVIKTFEAYAMRAYDA
jgi:hypothetical protein